MKHNVILTILEDSQLKIIQIGGASATGKTTLAMTLTRDIMHQVILSNMKPIAFWIDSNRGFSKERFIKICQSNQLSNYIMYRPVSSLDDQQTAITQIDRIVKGRPKNSIPILIIDDISYHVRNIESKLSFGQFSAYLESFFENQVKKILQIQHETQCYAIIVHQMSIKNDKPQITFRELYEPIRSLVIELANDELNQSERHKGNFIANIGHESNTFKIGYTISDIGILFS